MTYAILSVILFAGILIYLDIRICKLERYIRWYISEITRLNFELTNLQIKFENMFKESNNG